MARIVVISDPHLSPTHGFFWDNWRRACAAVNRMSPDAVIVSGDLCINGPESDAEMVFAGHALRSLNPPVYAIPGNHDVGDEPPGQEAGPIIDGQRLQRWNSVFGLDRFAFDLGGWRMIGVNAQLLGSGLPQEKEQMHGLMTNLLGHRRRPCSSCTNRCSFDRRKKARRRRHRSIPNRAPACFTACAPRRLRSSSAAICTATATLCGMGSRHVWAPSTAFLLDAPVDADAAAVVGILSVIFDEDEVRIEVTEVPGLVAYDLAELKEHGRYRYLRDMPSCPPAT